MQLQREATRKPGAGGSPPPPAANQAALSKAHQGMNVMKEIEDVLAGTKKALEQKQKEARSKLICCCGDPSCGIGPMTTSVPA